MKCAQCELPLGEIQPPEPCPRCGSSARVLEVQCKEALLTSDDHLAVEQRRDEKTIGFSQSARGGRISTARLEGDDRFSYGLSGPSPRGEEDSIQACRILADALNAHGESWAEPVPKYDADVDCEIPDRSGTKKLLVQVSRAVHDEKLWETLGATGQVERLAAAADLASHLKSAIEAKARKMPPGPRKEIVLALDATRLPALAFHASRDEFRQQFGRWATRVGFREIWVVGPNASLTWRLDCDLEAA